VAKLEQIDGGAPLNHNYSNHMMFKESSIPNAQLSYFNIKI
jgi:hypothetical protein